MTQRLGIVGLVPLPERGGVDHDNGVLDDGLGAHQLIVSSVVDNVDDTGFAGDGLGAPGKVTGVQTKGTVLLVTSSNSDGVNALWTKSGGIDFTGQVTI